MKDDFISRDQVLIRQDRALSDLFEKAQVSILGCGGLGSNIAMMLARAGVGRLFLYDFDKVEPSNLNRQNYTYKELGQSKVLTTKERILETLPYVKVEAEEVHIDKTSIGKIGERTDFFVEAFDNEKSKALVFDYFVGRKGKYLVSASGLSGLGDLSDIRIKRIENVTLIGDFKSRPDRGLYLPYVSLVASLEALEVLKIIEDGGKNGR